MKALTVQLFFLMEALSKHDLERTILGNNRKRTSREKIDLRIIEDNYMKRIKKGFYWFWYRSYKGETVSSSIGQNRIVVKGADALACFYWFHMDT